MTSATLTRERVTAMSPQPSLYIPHGGGPCFFMDDPANIWAGMAAYLRNIAGTLPEPPSAILIVSAHWETEGFAFSGAAAPDLIFDYNNFPPHTYALRYPAAGAPALAVRCAALLADKAIDARIDNDRGLDHGVFIPLMVAFPEADIPVVAMSIDRSFDPALHMAAGAALAPLRDEGVLVVGSGMSFHNMRAYGDPRAKVPSQAFDRWLADTVSLEAPRRSARLEHWDEAPAGRYAHPHGAEEHLLPLMVAAGASSEPGNQSYSELVLGTAISAFRFE